jgi:hypothetical protein
MMKDDRRCLNTGIGAKTMPISLNPIPTYDRSEKVFFAAIEYAAGDGPE